MRWFKTVFSALIRMLFPWNWQTPRMLAWLNAIIAPIKRMDADFQKNRDANLYFIKRTAAVTHIEAVLNDRWDEALRRIKVVDGLYYDPINLYKQAENKPVHLYTNAENDPKWLYKDVETYSMGADFIVQVPYFIQYDPVEMKALINKYKLTTKAYIIQQVL